MAPILTVATYVCDACEQTIDTVRSDVVWVDATKYEDRIFHEQCWVKTNGPQVARLLKLNIKLRGGGKEGDLAWGPEWRSRGQ